MAFDIKTKCFSSAERVNSGVILREQLNRVRSCWECKGQINDNIVIWRVDFPVEALVHCDKDFLPGVAGRQVRACYKARYLAGNRNQSSACTVFLEAI